MPKPVPEQELHDLTDTGKILIRARESAQEFDKQLSNSNRLADWIRRQLRSKVTAGDGAKR